jgi:hypothetical protein
MRQGKGAAAGTAASSAPVTPKAGRKRAAPSAPSTGNPTVTKKARRSAAKPVQPAPVITLDDDDDDDDDNEYPPISLDTPIQGPRFTETYAKQFYGTDAQIPALDTTQAETPNEEEDFKPHTPSDAAAFSFSQAPSSSGFGVGGYNLDAYPISQPSFAPSSEFSKTWVHYDFEDEV